MTSSYQNTLDPDGNLDFYSIMAHIVGVWLMASLLIPLMGVPPVVLAGDENESAALAAGYPRPQTTTPRSKYGGKKEYPDPYGEGNYKGETDPPYGKIPNPDQTTQKIPRSTAGLCPPMPKPQTCPTPAPCNCPKPMKCQKPPKCPPVQKCPKPITCPTPECPKPGGGGGGGHGWTPKPKPAPSGGYGS